MSGVKSERFVGNGPSWKAGVVAAATAVAVIATWLAAERDLGILIPVLVVNIACVALLKYVPLMAGLPALAAMLYESTNGSGQVSYFFAVALFGILGVARFFKWLPGGWSRP